MGVENEVTVEAEEPETTVETPDSGESGGQDDSMDLPDAPVDDTGETLEASEEPEPEPDPYDTFTWDDWDGNFESFPEGPRRWASRVHGHWESKYNEHQAKQDYQQKVYEALISEQGDPRVGELEEKLAEAMKNHDSVKSEYEKFSQQYAQEQESRAKAENEKWKADNKDVLDNPESLVLVRAMLQRNYTREEAASIARLNKAQRQTVFSFMTDAGVTPTQALALLDKLGKNNAERTPTITDTGSRKAKVRGSGEESEVLDFDGARLAAIERVLAQ